MTSTTSPERSGPPVPSANFLLVALIFTGFGFAIGSGSLNGAGAGFVFVMTGFVLALCLHGFARARVARRMGDGDIPAAGNLTLDPRRFTEPVSTLVLPVLFTILGGIGVPGGNGPVNRHRMFGAARQALAAAAGPGMRVAFLLALAALYGLTGTTSDTLRAVLAVSALFQTTALVLSLLPIPGLDGYGIVSPWLPETWRGVGDRLARHSGLVLTVLFLLCEVFGRSLFRISFPITALLGFAPEDIVVGYRLIRLW